MYKLISTKEKYKKALEMKCPNCGCQIRYSAKTNRFFCPGCTFTDYDENGLPKLEIIKKESNSIRNGDLDIWAEIRTYMTDDVTSTMLFDEILNNGK